MKWTKLSSKKLFEHPRHSVYEDEVRLPDGQETKYLHFGETEDAAMVLAVDDEGRYLFQKEYSYPPDVVLYQLPGGLIEKDEDPLTGASRELAEEAGLAGDMELLGWFYVNNRRSKQKMYFYKATNLKQATAQKDPEEMFEDHWLTADQINQMISTNEICNYTALAGWAIYTAKQSNV